MSKQEFLGALYNGLSGLPKEDIENSVQFYSEMIDDRMDEGMTENEAVEDIGSVNEIIKQILSELVKRTVSKKHDWKVWEIVLLAVGSPVWFPLLLTAIVIVLTVYIVIWSVVLSFYAADFSLAVSGIFTLVSTVAYAFTSNANIFAMLVLIGGAFVCAGLSILSFFGINQITKGMVFVSKKIWIWIKSLFIRKEEV